MTKREADPPDLDKDDGDDVTGGALAAVKEAVPLPSDNPGTNLMLAYVIVKGASSLFSEDVRRRIDEIGNPTKDSLSKLDGKAILTTLGLYGASKLAGRSLPGLALLTGGLVAKTLYDRGKARQMREAQEAEPPEEA